MSRCPQGHAAPPGAGFCPECGSPIGLPLLVEDEPGSRVPQPPPLTHASLTQRLEASLTPCLEEGEQLRAVGEFQSGGMWAELPKATFFTMRDWAVGITEIRVILAKQSRLNQNNLLQDSIFSVGREEVVVKGRQLRITSPDPKVPKVLIAHIGSGYHKDEFKKALSN